MSVFFFIIWAFLRIKWEIGKHQFNLTKWKHSNEIVQAKFSIEFFVSSIYLIEKKTDHVVKILIYLNSVDISIIKSGILEQSSSLHLHGADFLKSGFNKDLHNVTDVE